jgi:hypothetical protein
MSTIQSRMRRTRWLILGAAAAAWAAWLAFRRRGIAKPCGRTDSWTDAYSTGETRSRWIRQLGDESERRPRMTFSRVGHLTGLAGAFPVADSSPKSAARWLLTHREMFGLGAGDELAVREPTDREEALGQRAADGEPAARPGYERDAESSRAIVRTFEVVHQGVPHSGMQLSTTIVPGPAGALVAGVLNTFSPTFKRIAAARLIAVEDAWAAAEAAFGAQLEHQEAVQTWFDPSWALRRVPGMKELHWRLLGLDQGGAAQYAFVRVSDNAVTYHTPLVTAFFSVPQTDLDTAGNVLWDSQTLKNGCAGGSPGCVNPALAESMFSRDIFPKVVDLWYRESSGGAPPFVWPFSGPNKSPFDNQGGRAIRVVVADPPKVGFNVAGIAYRLPDTYHFPEGTVTRGYVGHEYGHVLLGRLKFVHPGGPPSDANGPIPAASFTEAMADFVGIVTEHLLSGAVPPGPSAAHWMTDFSIGDYSYDTRGSVVDAPPVAWDIRSGDCAGRGRERLGRAFIEAWGEDRGMYGGLPLQVGRDTYRAWWVDIMRSFALLPEFSFPTIKDFYDATISRLWTYPEPIERGVSYFLSREMEKLGLDADGCF